MIIFIYGEDSFRGSQKVKELKDKYLREVDETGSSLARIDGAATDMKEINEKGGTSSLFARKRMVIIDNIFLNSSPSLFEKVEEYFRQKEQTSDNIIIFNCPEIKQIRKKTSTRTFLVDNQGREKPLSSKAAKLFQFLSQQQYVQHYPLMSEQELFQWIKERVEEKNATISQQGIRSLVGLAGNDPWQLYHDINKLVNYKKGDTGQEEVAVEEDDIKLLVKGSFDENIFAFTDALSTRDRKQAARLLEQQYEAGLSDAYLLSMVIRQFKILLRIREALDNGYTSNKIISQLQLHPFVVQKGINQVRKFRLEELKKIFSKLVEADHLMKTGKQDTRLMLDLLIVSL